MAETLTTRIKHAWSAFRARDETDGYSYKDLGYGSSVSPMYPRFSRGNERSIITSVYNRMALDVASFDIYHVKIDGNGRYSETVNDSLNQRMTVEANKDQTGRVFIQDICMSMFDEGCVAVVPVETSISPLLSGTYTIDSMRVGKIVEWYPNHIRVELYNDQIGHREQIIVPKVMAAIIENPLYAIMNEPNSTLQRLIRKLNMLDAIDEQSSSGKLDLIIQLPYVIKSEARQKQAEERRNAIESQLKGSRYGIAYTDGTERITQLNRPSENNLLAQVQYLTQMLYNQLGITEDIFTGKATAQALRNYYDRTIEPIVTVIIEEFRRKFLTKTARRQGHTIMGFRDMFRLTPVTEMAEIADALSRNGILTPNELRQVIGVKPSSEKQADELGNRNMPEYYSPKKQSTIKDEGENTDER